MEPALKQRVVGAVVLVALAVIFLPMLVKGPAPESGVSDVPLKLPDAPPGDGTMQTRELPLVTPGAAPTTGVVGMDATQADDTDAAASTTMLPAATAGGDYAVTFGRYATAADADKVVAALKNSQLPGYQETTTDNGRTLYSVRIGPYATQADAEAARLRAAHVRDDVGARVITLNADAAAATETAATATATAPSAAPTAPAASTTSAKPEPAPETRAAATKPAEPAPKPATPKSPAPKPAEPVATATRPAAPAAADTGFAVQLGAFASAEEANKLRDRARAAGLRAFVESVRTDKGVLSRVRVGPVLTRAEADQLKAQVALKLGIGDAIVKPHP
ncbi:SPOR domain-containing protein [Lysobacter yangpyeongensis]|uniref:SPOR domain-containing protein n=1 Tax=Lysobacter yangpyeongensis TaxID=346182 RepID=A0ABW0SLN7_9GAMM